MLIKKLFLFINCLLFLALIILPITGQTTTPNANTLDATFRGFAVTSGLTPDAATKPTSPLYIIMLIIKIGLGFLGVIFLIIMIISGFKWMTTSNP